MLSDLTGLLLDGKFKVLAPAGTGGMGVVYKAVQIDLNRTVAIKILRQEMLFDLENSARFEREAKLISKLSHKNIAMFYQYGFVNDSQPYMAMEFLEGPSLQDLLSEHGAIDWKRSVEICSQLCAGMAYAHKNNVLHRDLKPSNIFVLDDKSSDPKVKIVDFGLAKPIGEPNSEMQKLTKTGLLIGTVQYLSPEQCQGHAADIRSDIYSLACVFYQMISGKPPFTADNPIGLLHKHVNEIAQPLCKIAPSNSFPALDAVALKALSKDPADRYQSMEDFDEALASLFSSSKIVTVSTKPATKRVAPGIRLVLIILASVISAAALCYYVLFHTEAGLLWRCAIELNSKNSQEAAYLKWLSAASDLHGNDQTLARKLEEKVFAKYQEANRSASAIADLCLSEAQLQAKKKRQDLANFWAKKAFFDYLERVPSVGRKGSTNLQNHEQLKGRMNQTVVFIDPSSINRKQANQILNKYVKCLAGSCNTPKDYVLVDFLVNVAAKNKIFGDSSLCEVYSDRDSILLIRRDWDKLKTTVRETEICIKQAFNPPYEALFSYYIHFKDVLSVPSDYTFTDTRATNFFNHVADGALECLHHLSEETAPPSINLLTLSRILQLSSRYKEALSMVESCKQIHNGGDWDEFDKYFLSGNLNLELGQYRAAISSCQHAMQSWFFDDDPLSSFGGYCEICAKASVAHLALGDKQTAAKELLTAAQLVESSLNKHQIILEEKEKPSHLKNRSYANAMRLLSAEIDLSLHDMSGARQALTGITGGFPDNGQSSRDWSLLYLEAEAEALAFPSKYEKDGLVSLIKNLLDKDLLQKNKSRGLFTLKKIFVETLLKCKMAE